jgi:hypothetical protein
MQKAGATNTGQMPEAVKELRMTSSTSIAADDLSSHTPEYTGPMEWQGAIIDHKDTPPPAQFKVLACLAQTLDWKTGTGYASEPYLAEKAGIKDLRTVRAALTWVRSNGFAIRTRKGHRVNDTTALASEWQLAMPTQQDIQCTVGANESDLMSNPTGHPMQANSASDAPNRTLDVPPSSLSISSPSSSSRSDNERSKEEIGEEGKSARAEVGTKGSAQYVNDYWVQTSGPKVGLFTKVTTRPKRKGEVLVSLDRSEAARFWKLTSRQQQMNYMLGKVDDTQPGSRPQAGEDWEPEVDDDVQQDAQPAAKRRIVRRKPSSQHAEDRPAPEPEPVDPEREAIWERVLKLFADVYPAELAEDQHEATKASFEADLGFHPNMLSLWTMEQFQATEDYLTTQLAARRAA